ANVAAGSLAVTAADGERISLDPAAPIECNGLTASTVAELIAEVDGLLAALESQPLADPGVAATYGHIVDCCEAINNGIGVCSMCPDQPRILAAEAALDRRDVIELYRPMPNPFSTLTRMAYAVAEGGEVVDLGVYDVAGRLVRKLASGYQAAGRYQVSWDGTSATGVPVKPGVFFLRGAV